MRRDSASGFTDPRSQKPRACSKRSLYGNREIPEATERVPRPVRLGQTEGDVNATGKSDSGGVSVKRTNKGAQPDIIGQPPAEPVEKSPGAMGNPEQPTTTGTPRPEAVSSALDRVREAAKRDSKLKLTSLLHHVTVDLLREAYLALKRNTATGIDGVTWSKYGQFLRFGGPHLVDEVRGAPHRRPAVLRLLRKFLSAGVSEDGEWTKTVVGMPQVAAGEGQGRGTRIRS